MDNRLAAGELLTVAQAAAWLQISRSSIYKLFGTGALPTISVFRCRRVERAALEKFVSERRTHG